MTIHHKAQVDDISIVERQFDEMTDTTSLSKSTERPSLRAVIGVTYKIKSTATLLAQGVSTTYGNKTPHMAVGITYQYGSTGRHLCGNAMVYVDSERSVMRARGCALVYKGANRVCLAERDLLMRDILVANRKRRNSLPELLDIEETKEEREIRASAMRSKSMDFSDIDFKLATFKPLQKMPDFNELF